MTEALLVTVSAGTGPIEARRFAALLTRALTEELKARGCFVSELVSQGPRDDPTSTTFQALCDSAAVDDLVGTHALIHASETRGKRSRKRWFVGVSVGTPTEATVSLVACDVSFETCRASGAGGQHVNKTESAVRAVHLPTGIAVRIQSERSQHRNKQVALETLSRRVSAFIGEAKKAAQVEHHRRKLNVERGRPIATWRMDNDRLVRIDSSDSRGGV